MKMQSPLFKKIVTRALNQAQDPFELGAFYYCTGRTTIKQALSFRKFFDEVLIPPLVGIAAA